MALENKMKVNIDSLRADPLLIKDHEDNSFAILDDSLDSKLVDIATLKAYDKALRGTELGETFDTLKEIQVNIKNEEARAKEEEEKLYLEIQAEEQRAQAAEATLNAKIDSEIDRAILAEQALNEKIDNEITRSIAKDEELSKAISAETDRATAAEQGLNEIINSETQRAIVAEQLLDKNLSAEVTRSTQQDATHGQAIQNEVNRAIEKDDEIASNLVEEGNRAEAEETTLKNSKLDKSIYEDYIKDRAMTDSALKEDASSKASQALEEAKKYTDEALEKWQFSTATEVDIEDLFKENN